MDFIYSKQAPKPIGAYSQAVRAGSLLVTSGQIALTAGSSSLSGDIRTQTKQVLDNLHAVLQEANCKVSDVIKTTVYLTDMDDFSSFNEIYEGFFGSHAPARTTVGVAQLPKGALVEIDVMALCS